MPGLPEAIVEAYADFKASELEQFHVWLRRQRAAQLRTLLSQPSQIDLATFNQEVWAVETAAYLRGALLPHGILGEKTLDSERIAELREALTAGELELHGNYMWGAGSHVFGASLHQDDGQKLELVRAALEILNGDAPPLQKAQRIDAIAGFGPNIATGLVMVYHPAEFQISNQVSKAVVAELGFANAPLTDFQESVAAIRSALGAEDYLELDWFMYLLKNEVPSGGDVHLVVKWAAKYGADTDSRHIEVANEKGAVWWGLFAAPDSDWKVSQQWIDQLHAQLDAGRDAFVFLVGPNCWRCRLLDVQYDREKVDPELIPAYYGSEGSYHLWVKLASFESVTRDELYRLLDPATKPGRPVALGNQTNPLIVRFRESPRVWWVNQGDSYQRARDGRFLWAPLVDKAGRTPEHWRTMRHLRPGDFVLNYANTQLRATSRVLDEAVPAPRPNKELDQAWSNDGLRVELDWHDLEQPIDLSEIPVDWRTSERGPFGKAGAVNQGYLFPLSDAFAAKLTSRFPQIGLKGGSVVTPPKPARATFDLETLQERVVQRGLRISSEIVANLLAALQSGKHLILTGPPGTAKTTLAEVVASVAADAGLCSGYTLTTATADWTTYETIGGLKPDTDNQLSFQEGHFLEAIRRNQWLVIDELNRSNFDRAFGQLFTVLSGQAVELPYERIKGAGRLALVPEGAKHTSGQVEVMSIPATWRVIATMNVFDKSLLFEMSFALMRRFAFVEIPSPPVDDFLHLIEEQTDGDIQARDLATRFLAVRKLKDLGPAVFMDLARFVHTRREISSASDGQLAFEAFYSYLLPQFEGIDEVAGEQLYALVKKLVGDANNERLRATLRAVLGVELAAAKTPTHDDEDDDDFPEPAELLADEHDDE